MTEKQYRASNDANYVTTSLTLDKEIIDFLELEIAKTDEKNMSKFIEDNVFDANMCDVPKRRVFKTFPRKKTFTFTEDFFNKIKLSGNMSLFIEIILIEKFDLK